MRDFVYHARRCGPGAFALVIAIGFVATAGANPQRRGRMALPTPPAPVESTPMIDGLKKALKALGETDRDYDGHREKAITHISTAIRDLELPTAKGKSDAAAAKAIAGKTAAKGATGTQAEADASLHKALTALFAVHHQLADKASTKGRIHADAQVRIAIQELGLAQKSAKAAAAPAGAATKPGK